MNRRDTFLEVLHNLDDQVIVRHLLLEVMSPEQKEWVVDRFNEAADAYNARIREMAEDAAKDAPADSSDEECICGEPRSAHHANMDPYHLFVAMKLPVNPGKCRHCATEGDRDEANQCPTCAARNPTKRCINCGGGVASTGNRYCSLDCADEDGACEK